MPLPYPAKTPEGIAAQKETRARMKKETQRMLTPRTVEQSGVLLSKQISASYDNDFHPSHFAMPASLRSLTVKNRVPKYSPLPEHTCFHCHHSWLSSHGFVCPACERKQ